MGLAGDIVRQVEAASIQGFHDAGLLVLEQARHNVGKVDPAEDPDPGVSLAESGHLIPDGNGVVIVFDIAYAAKQHENQHLKHPRGGGPKYLERALTEILPRLESVIGSAVGARLASGLLSSDTARSHH